MRQEQKGMGEHGNKGSTERDPVTHGNRQDLLWMLTSSTAFPRFILLDRDGKIISANMTRPSDPKTAEKFNELLGL